MEFLPILQDFIPCWGRCPKTIGCFIHLNSASITHQSATGLVDSSYCLLSELRLGRRGCFMDINNSYPDSHIFTIELRDFVEINDVTYWKLDELKVVTQPVKIIRTLDPFKPKIERCELGEREWSSEKKGWASVGKNRGCVRIKSISYF